MDTHTAGVVSHVNQLIEKARAAGRAVTAVEPSTGTRFEIASVHGDGVMIVCDASGRHCSRWRMEVAHVSA